VAADQIRTSLLNSSILPKVLLSFSIWAQVEPVEMEKKMLQKLAQKKALNLAEIKDYLQSMPEKRKG
jgi:hypothetical protein